MYAGVYWYMHIHVFLCLCIRTSVSVCAYAYVYVYAYLYVYVYACAIKCGTLGIVRTYLALFRCVGSFGGSLVSVYDV